MWDFFLYGGKHYKLHIRSLLRSFFTFLHWSPREQLHQGCLCRQSATYFWHFMTFVGFSLVLDSANQQNTSYFDLRISVYMEEHHTIANLHGCVLLMFQQHTDEVMFEMVFNFLTILCPNCKTCLLGLLSSGAWNMTGHVASVVTRF
jgi:hypothetical protein